jgi:hypothetical protein
LPSPFGDEQGNVGHADLELQGRGDAVEHFEPVVLGVLTVGMKIDEPGCDDQPIRIDRSRALQVGGGDAGDCAIGDADVAHAVQRGLRIHDAPAPDDDVVAWLR